VDLRVCGDNEKDLNGAKAKIMHGLGLGRIVEEYDRHEEPYLFLGCNIMGK
jgi:hypothetical protein